MPWLLLRAAGYRSAPARGCPPACTVKDTRARRQTLLAAAPGVEAVPLQRGVVDLALAERLGAGRVREQVPAVGRGQAGPAVAREGPLFMSLLATGTGWPGWGRQRW
jgi:hypothetical protein